MDRERFEKSLHEPYLLERLKRTPLHQPTDRAKECGQTIERFYQRALDQEMTRLNMQYARETDQEKRKALQNKRMEMIREKQKSQNLKKSDEKWEEELALNVQKA